MQILTSVKIKAGVDQEHAIILREDSAARARLARMGIMVKVGKAASRIAKGWFSKWP